MIHTINHPIIIFISPIPTFSRLNLQFFAGSGGSGGVSGVCVHTSLHDCVLAPLHPAACQSVCLAGHV